MASQGGAERPEHLTPGERLGYMSYDLRSVIGVTRWDWEEGVPRVMLESDVITLFSMSEFEAETIGFCFEPEMPFAQQGVKRCQLDAALSLYHEALPFSEAERRWLSSNFDEAYFAPVAEEGFRVHSAELVTAGVRRVVQGGDLTRRWWSWRRKTDEFRDQGSLDQARSGLESIVRLFIPEPPSMEIREDIPGGKFPPGPY